MMLARSLPRAFAGLSLPLLACLLTGCPNPNIYGTPRTTPKGGFAHTIAVEAINLAGDSTTLESDSSGNTVEKKERLSFTVPTFPTYQLRYGATDNLDIGGSIRNMSSLGLDVKYNPVRSKSFDLAVDPMIQFFRVSSSSSDGSSDSVSLTYFHLPILLGFNLSETFSVVATPGIVYALSSTNSKGPSGDDRSSLSSSGGVLARMGLGLNIRPTAGFSLQPEVTYMRFLNDSSVSFMMIGLGFNFGALPTF